MPKKKINPMTQDQMLNVPYQFDMVPASEAVGPSASLQTEAQRVGRAMSKKYEADDDFERYKEDKKGRSKITDESAIVELLNDRMNAASENLRTAKSQAGYKKGGDIDFSKIIRNKKTGVLSLKKAGGGIVRGCGIASKGHGRGKMY